VPAACVGAEEQHGADARRHKEQQCSGFGDFSVGLGRSDFGFVAHGNRPVVGHVAEAIPAPAKIKTFSRPAHFREDGLTPRTPCKAAVCRRGCCGTTLWSVYQQGGYVANIDVLVAVYLGGWFLVTLAGHVASRWFGHRWSPPAHPLLVSAVAGAVWPLLLIGLIELTSIAVWVIATTRRV
jgi:hypothetical protein